MEYRKTLLMEKFKAINVYILKEQRSQVMNLTFHLTHWKKEEQIQPKLDERRK